MSSNISVNSKLFAKTLKGVKQWPRGRCLTKKTRGQKSLETVSLRKESAGQNISSLKSGYNFNHKIKYFPAVTS